MSNIAVEAFNGPATFICADFIANVRKRFLEHNSVRAEFGDYVHRAWDEIEAAKKGAPIDDQLRLSILYDNVVTTGRETILFLAFCLKNVDCMPPVVEKLKPEFVKQRGIHLRIGAFSHQESLIREIRSHGRMLFDVLEKLEPMITPETWEHRARTPFRGDPFLIEQRPGQPLKRTDFIDWLEFNFYRFHRIPLAANLAGQPPSERLQRHIARETATPVFRLRTAERIAKGDMQRAFPGLSLDDTPRNREELEGYSQHVGEHVPTFTPSRTATVVSLPRDSYAPNFGRLSFAPERNGPSPRFTR